jgi:PAS domain S-box-containing protein
MSRSIDDQLEERQVDRRRSQRRHQDVTETEILESMPDGVMTFDPEWRITYVNSAAEHLYDMPRQSLVGRNHWEAFPATIGTLVEREYRRAMSDRVTVRFENLDEAHGRLLEIDACPMQNGGLAVYGRDVTTLTRAEEQLTAINAELMQEVNERRRAGDELSRANARITEILESITDAFSAWDQEFRFTYVNARAAQLLGMSRDQLIGRSVWDLFPDSVGTEVYRKCQQAMAERVPLYIEATTADRWYENYIYPTREGLSIYWREITERKRVEATLRRSEACLAEAQRLSHTGSGAWNVSTGDAFWSDETYRIYGFAPGTVRPSAELFFGIVHAEDRLWLEQAFESVVRERKAYDLEFRIVRPDGSTRFIHSVGTAVTNEAGDVTEVVGTVLDVTERKRAEEALRASNRRIEITLESIADEFWAVDREWRVTYVNDRALGRMKRTRGEEITRERILGKKLWEMLPEQVGTVLYDKYHEAMREQKTVECESFFPGMHSWVETHLYPSEDGLSAYSRDITARKKSEEALREAQATLAHAARLAAIGELTASLAHELSQPLAAIATQAGACLGWLVGDKPDLEEARAAVQQIIRDAERGGRAIEQTRRLARKSTAEKTVFDMNDAIGEVLLFIDGAIRDHRIAVRKSLAAELPLVSGIRVQIQQVVLNLALNAIDAMEHVSDGHRELAIRSERVKGAEGDSVLVALQDSGIGFRDQDLARLFDAFYTTKSEGLGLGLSISRSIIVDHGGRLWATRNDEGGATFQFVVPTGVPRL